MIDGNLDIPWNLAAMMNKVEKLIKDVEAEVVDMFREGNNLADFSDNQVFFFLGLENIIYLSKQELPGRLKQS